jgi:hypothetical protein
MGAVARYKSRACDARTAFGSEAGVADGGGVALGVGEGDTEHDARAAEVVVTGVRFVLGEIFADGLREHKTKRGRVV